MKKTIIRYVVSSLITWATGFVGAFLILLDSMPISEIPLTSAFWFGVLMLGIRILVKSLVESLPELIKEIKLHYEMRKESR